MALGMTLVGFEGGGGLHAFTLLDGCPHQRLQRNLWDAFRGGGFIHFFTSRHQQRHFWDAFQVGIPKEDPKVNPNITLNAIGVWDGFGNDVFGQGNAMRS